MAYVTDSFDEKIIELLKQGGAGLLPTDTIYGLSCRALDEEAVERLHSLKRRDTDKPFIVLISDLKMLDLLSISKEKANTIKNYWPGAISIVMEAPDAPIWLHRGTSSLAVRLPDYPELLHAIDQSGPIVSTSANLQGEEPVKSASEAQKIFGDELDFYVDIGELNNPPSTLAVIKNSRLHVERSGAVKID